MEKHLQIFTCAVDQRCLGRISQKRPQRADISKLQRVYQIRLITPTHLQQGDLRKKRITTAKFGIDCHQRVMSIV